MAPSGSPGGACCILIRTLGMESLQAAPSDAPAHFVEIDAAAAVERFAGAIRIPTISFENVEDTDSASFRTLHDYFEASYPLVHESLTREIIAGLSLLYTWEGSEPGLEPVVLMGHQDVVPVPAVPRSPCWPAPFARRWMVKT